MNKLLIILSIILIVLSSCGGEKNDASKLSDALKTPAIVRVVSIDGKLQDASLDFVEPFEYYLYLGKDASLINIPDVDTHKRIYQMVVDGRAEWINTDLRVKSYSGSHAKVNLEVLVVDPLYKPRINYQVQVLF